MVFFSNFIALDRGIVVFVVNINKFMENSSTINDIDSVTRQAKVLIPSQKLQSEVDTAVNRYTSKASIKGFRTGKAPKQMVEKMYGDSIRWDVISKLISDTLQEVVQKNNLQMVGSPKIDITSNEPGKDLEFTADFSIYPTPTITGYDNVSVTVEKEEVADKAVDEVVNSYRRSRAAIKPAEGRDSVQADDVIDVTVTFNSKDGSATSPESATIGLGDGRLPKEFDDQVLGLKVGETREVKLSSGQEGELVYSVTLNKISERELPEFTDEFVSGLGIDEKTVLEIRTNIHKKLSEQAELAAKDKAKQLIVEKLIEINEFLVPQPLIDDEIRQMLIRVGAVSLQTTKFEDIPADPFRESFGAMATKRVKGVIILDQIAQVEKITPNDDDLRSAFQEVARQQRISEAEARKRFQGRALINLAIEVTRDKTQEFLVSKATISYTNKEKQ